MVIADDETTVACLSPVSFDSTEPGLADMATRTANAHLISAAPDLLAACEAALPYLEECQPPPSHEGPCNPEAGCDAGCMAAAGWADTIHRLRTAKAKAKGKDQP